MYVVVTGQKMVFGSLVISTILVLSLFSAKFEQGKISVAVQSWNDFLSPRVYLTVYLKFNLTESSFNMTSGGGAPPFGCLKILGPSSIFSPPPLLVPCLPKSLLNEKTWGE